MSKDRKISGSKRILVWLKTNGRCWYCGIETIPNTQDNFNRGNSFIVEHLDNNGGNSIDNLLPGCSNCNRKKRQRTLEEFREYLTMPKFSENQIEYLKSCGIEIPKPEKMFVFYGETL